MKNKNKIKTTALIKENFFALWHLILKKLGSEIYIQTAFRLLFFVFIFYLIISIILNYSKGSELDYLAILNLLVSIIAIIIAIIITYLLSKLFAEKSERIQRKHDIDELSLKVTLFRKLAFNIKGSHDFWEESKFDVKQNIDHKYKWLTYNKFFELDHDSYMKIKKDIGEMTAQAYLGLKGLENKESTFTFFIPFKPTNYSLDEIADFKNYSNSFWYLLDKVKDKFNFDKVPKYEREIIKELYKKITGKVLTDDAFKKDITELFGYFEAEIFDKLYYLTKLNEKRMPKLFLSGLINLSIFLMILIVSLIIYAIKPNNTFAYFSTIILVASFIANTVDLVVILGLALKAELSIKDFYKI